jgi:hypothetical protein
MTDLFPQAKEKFAGLFEVSTGLIVSAKVQPFCCFIVSVLLTHCKGGNGGTACFIGPPSGQSRGAVLCSKKWLVLNPLVSSISGRF